MLVTWVDDIMIQRLPAILGKSHQIIKPTLNFNKKEALTEFIESKMTMNYDYSVLGLVEFTQPVLMN